MIYFYDPPERVSGLLDELERWRGTKFVPEIGEGALAGVRADCVSFAHAVYVNTGAMAPIDWPPYVVKHGGEKMLAVLLDTLNKVPHLAAVWMANEPDIPLRPGDLMVGSTGRAFHHVAIKGLRSNAWHCEPGAGVAEANAKDPMFSRRLLRVYRFFNHS